MSRLTPATPAFYGRKLREYALNYQMITTDNGLRAVCEAASTASAVALDTEFVRTRTYYPQLGLLQLFDGQQVSLIDPLTINDWAPMRDLLLNRDVTKYLHAGSEDLEVFLNAFNLMPQPLIDTRSRRPSAAAQCLGLRLDGGRVFRGSAG